MNQGKLKNLLIKVMRRDRKNENDLGSRAPLLLWVGAILYQVKKENGSLYL